MANKGGPFSNYKNVRRGPLGPIVYEWAPIQGTPQKNKPILGVGCNNVIDNITTYVYDISPINNVDHIAYVYCDYVV